MSAPAGMWVAHKMAVHKKIGLETAVKIDAGQIYTAGMCGSMCIYQKFTSGL